MNRFLGENAVELLPDSVIPTVRVREDMKCLVCGAECNNNDVTRVDCKENDCKYGAHEGCLAIMFQVCNELFNAEMGFSCNDIVYQAKPEWISKFATGGSGEKKAIMTVSYTHLRAHET